MAALAIGVVGIAIAVSAAMRWRGHTFRDTGLTRPVDVLDLPSGFRLGGSFRCIEIERTSNGQFSARADGGPLRNESGEQVLLVVNFEAQSTAGEIRSIETGITVEKDQELSTFYLLPEVLAGNLTSCRLMFAAGQPGSDVDFEKESPYSNHSPNASPEAKTAFPLRSDA